MIIASTVKTRYNELKKSVGLGRKSVIQKKEGLRSHMQSPLDV